MKDYNSRFNYENLYADLERRTLSEKSKERTRIRREKMAMEELKIRTYKTAGVIVFSGILAFTLATNAIESLHNQIYLSTMSRICQTEIIGPETHRTLDNEHYFFDYSDIAKKVEQSDNVDQSIYFVERNIGEYQTNLVLEHTGFKSLDNYLRMRGYDSIDEFEKDMSKRLILEGKQSKNENELKRMSEQHPETITISYENQTGGKI